VATVIISGIHYIRLQGYLRNQWRNSLYKFLAQDDYHRLVEVPVQRAETGFWLITGAGGIMVVASLIAVYFVAKG
jgi:hypothetical protein